MLYEIKAQMSAKFSKNLYENNRLILSEIIPSQEPPWLGKSIKKRKN